MTVLLQSSVCSAMGSEGNSSESWNIHRCSTRRIHCCSRRLSGGQIDKPDRRQQRSLLLRARWSSVAAGKVNGLSHGTEKEMAAKRERACILVRKLNKRME